ncbi:arsenite transport protein [Halosimplex carlsbadense 2-9-1]|uniref:Arsenite transport protein n=1 Tax=Halosimplex carlsbadense 2-9-1 TaxID=797114 RepID=M0CNX9_9EURY|nr:SLC13 family permease [Halosimplex carlsbadense]ELZ23559.1 arsenite transport protein [Halosimplex carlsbadense 2-9-1]
MVLGLSTGALVVFALIAVALGLFVSEWLPPDITAIGVLVALAVLEPYTGVTATEALQAFASRATVTIIAMYVLSAGIEETGVVDYLGAVLAEVTGGDETRLLGATVGVTGLSAGVVNNTPVVAVFIPMITGLSEKAGVSPSKLLMPLSFAAMLGGTLTLVGTSTTLLASDFSRDLLNHPLSMFEITPVGAVVLAVGLAYLLTVGRWLVPERIPAGADFTDEFDLDSHLSVLVVRDDSPLIGRTVTDALEDGAATDADPLADEPSGRPESDDRRTPDAPGPAAAEANGGTPDATAVADAADGDGAGPAAVETVGEPGEDVDVDVLQIERDDDAFLASATDREVRAGDRLTVRGSLQAVNRFAERHGLAQRSREAVTEERLAFAPHDATLVEAVVHPESRIDGRVVGDLQLRDRFDTTLLAVRRGDDLLRAGLDDVTLQRGDALLLQTDAATVDYFEEANYVVVTERVVDGDDTEGSTAQDPETEPAGTAPTGPGLGAGAAVAIGILATVITLAATGLVPVTIGALGGVVALVATGTLTGSQVYDAVNWSVVFLLAGLLPLGVAMQATGGAGALAAGLVAVGEAVPPLALLAVLYLLTAVVAAIITPVATVVLLIPVAVTTAQRLGLDGFPFLLVVTFAAANAFITPIGYQTNLMVYGPGGYKFTDYARVGAPLQLLLTVVTTLAIATMWPP